MNNSELFERRFEINNEKATDGDSGRLGNN
jgi:hypothetical protein